jgi:hypothetical protein
MRSDRRHIGSTAVYRPIKVVLPDMENKQWFHSVPIRIARPLFCISVKGDWLRLGIEFTLPRAIRWNYSGFAPGAPTM